MKIDMNLATTAWQEAYNKANEAKRWSIKALDVNLANAQIEYFKDILDVYIQDVRFADQSVTFYISSMNAREVKLFGELEVLLTSGNTVVLNSIEPDEYWEPYSDRASYRLEVRFAPAEAS